MIFPVHGKNPSATFIKPQKVLAAVNIWKLLVYSRQKKCVSRYWIDHNPNNSSAEYLGDSADAKTDKACRAFFVLILSRSVLCFLAFLAFCDWHIKNIPIRVSWKILIAFLAFFWESKKDSKGSSFKKKNRKSRRC